MFPHSNKILTCKFFNIFLNEIDLRQNEINTKCKRGQWCKNDSSFLKRLTVLHSVVKASHELTGLIH